MQNPDPLPGNVEEAKRYYLSAAFEGDPPDRDAFLAQFAPSIRGELLRFFTNLDDELAQEDEGVPPEVGGYLCGKLLGPPGSHGSAYESAYQGQSAALKLFYLDPEGVVAARRRFTRIKAIVNPNVIRLYDDGVDGSTGCYFYVMELLAGGSLKDRAEKGEWVGRPREAARVVAQIARGVAAIHEQQLLHGDLKPSNVLFRDDGTAVVTDCDLCHDPFAGGPGWYGTLRYQAPEQVTPGGVPTCASELYSLGVILYEMVTGVPLIPPGLVEEAVRARIQTDKPRDPRRLNPRVPESLARVCLACLQKDPRRRHHVPDGKPQRADLNRFADDLERVATWAWKRPRSWQPVSVPPERWLRRCAWRMRSNLRIAFLLALLVLLPVLFIGLTGSGDEASRVAATAKANDRVAQHVANSVLVQLQTYSLPALETMQRGQFMDAWRRARAGDPADLQQVLNEAFLKYNKDARFTDVRDTDQRTPPFRSIFALDRNGRILAISPPGMPIEGDNFGGRDYFRGALERRERTGPGAVHVSRVYQSVKDNYYKFGLSVAIDSDGQPDGVLVVTLTTDSTFGLTDAQLPDRHVSLAAPMDRPDYKSTDATRPPTEHVLLLHAAYQPGATPARFPAGQFPAHNPDHSAPELALPRTAGHPSPSDAYFDPVATDERVARNSETAAKLQREFGGQWVAAFAPVGNTEFVVIVQSRYADAVEPYRNERAWMVWWAAGFLVLGCGIVWRIAYLSRRASPW